MRNARAINQNPGSQLPRLATSTPLPNPFTPPIPAPAEEIRNLVACAEALKTAVESLGGQRGDPSNRAVTFNDLIDYGILNQAAVNSPRGTSGGGGGPVTLMGDATGTGSNFVTTTVVGLQNRPVNNMAPATGNVLTFTGADWRPAAPTGGGGGGIPEAPSDSVAYGRENLTWVPVLALTGDTLDGGNF